MSIRLRLTLSYAAFLMVAGALLMATVWVFLLRYVPDHARLGPGPGTPTRSDLLDAFVPRAGQALSLLLLLGLVGGWFLAGQMLAPLTRITSATRKVATGSLTHRIELEGRHDEFRELADSFDSMLSRLEARVAEQQRFAANASHELRTPLAVTKTLLDLARKDPYRDPAELVERLSAVNTRAIDLTEALLLLSRADQPSFAHDTVDLSLIADDVVETIFPLAAKRGVELQVQSTPTAIYGSRPLLTQMTMNLVHNAIVHNVEHRGWVRLTTGPDGSDTVLVVENSGEKLSPVVVATLAEPFQRGTQRVHADHAGVGLGLAIVTRIVEAHGGALMLTARADGGLRCTARMPSASPSAIRNFM